MSEFKLPDVGEGLTEAEIVTWHVAVGDVVEVNQNIVDIETAKSVVELPSPFAGTVSAILVEEGATVPVGTPIVAIGEPAQHEAQGASTSAESEERQPVLVGYGPRSGSTRRRRRVSAPNPPTTSPEPATPPAEPVEGSPESTVSSPEPTSPSPEPTASSPEPTVSSPEPTVSSPEPVEGPPRPLRALAKPPVRKLAKDHGIDLATVPCDGPIVTRADVEAVIAGLTQETEQAAAVTSPASGVGDVRIPVKGVRKATAQAMVSSAFTAPHVTEWVTLDVSATMELVERLRADRAFADVKVSPTLLVAKAVCLALRRTPELNATFDDAAQEIVLKGSINLGVAAATDRGLVVPNIPDADRMSLHDLAVALGDLTETARAGRTQPAQMQGGTFTITNVGVFGVDAGTPILNPGETGILAVGQIDRRPWVVDDQVVPRWVTTLAVSFDHRVVDGQQGSRFLADVAALLRDPALALTF